jgi:L-ascorbate metabolism protein UlaG (beta-lactamase superfamily)
MAMSPQAAFETDIIPTSAGELEILFIGHGSLRLTFGGKRIYVDPFSHVADYNQFPAADAILLTHEHLDHLDPSAIAPIRTQQTAMILTAACAERVPGGTVMANGDKSTVVGVPVKAVPAYNLLHRRENGELFHPPGRGNGYILTFGDKLVYVAGDTENIPEMKKLSDIEIAFLPMNLPYTMTPAMVADAAKAFRPRVVYPYHFGQTDVSELQALLRGDPDTEVRIRSMA